MGVTAASDHNELQKSSHILFYSSSLFSRFRGNFEGLGRFKDDSELVMREIGGI